MMIRSVNGVDVVVPAAEEAQIRAEWQANATQKAAKEIADATDAADKQTLAEARLEVSDAAIKLEALKPTAPKSIKDAAAILSRP